MCRLAYIPTDAVKNIDSDMLLKELEFLNKVGGGHGLGVGWLSQDKTPHVEKGLSLTPGKALELMQEHIDDTLYGFLYHSRIPSVGRECDELCMPFQVDDSLFVFNGTWKDWTNGYFALLGQGIQLPFPPDVSDAMVIAHLVAKWGPDILRVVGTGVTLVMAEDGVYLYKPSSSSDFCRIQLDGVELFASAATSAVDWDSVEDFWGCNGVNLCEDIPEHLLSKTRGVVHYLPRAKTTKPSENEKDEKDSEQAKDISQESALTNTDGLGYLIRKRVESSRGIWQKLLELLDTRADNIFPPVEWEEVEGCQLLEDLGLYVLELEGNWLCLSQMHTDAECMYILATEQELMDGDVVIFQDSASKEVWLRYVFWPLPIWVLVSEPLKVDPKDWDCIVAVIQQVDDEYDVIKPATWGPDFVLRIKERSSGLARWLTGNGYSTSHRILSLSELAHDKLWSAYGLITGVQPDFITMQEDLIDTLCPSREPDDDNDDSGDDFWRCDRCGLIATDDLLAGCWECPLCGGRTWHLITKRLNKAVSDNDDNNGDDKPLLTPPPEDDKEEE